METVKGAVLSAMYGSITLLAFSMIYTTYNDKITIATDPPTGCEYLIYGTAMTPRLLPNGDQVCGEVKGEKE